MQPEATLTFVAQMGLLTRGSKLFKVAAHRLGLDIDIVDDGGWLCKTMSVRVSGDYSCVKAFEHWLKNSFES